MSKPIVYPATVFWSDDDGGFIAIAPDLPGSSAFGETEAEAVRQLRDAIDAWIEAAESVGNPIPQPTDLTKPQDYSGRLLLRMPKTLHQLLADEAKREDVSLNQYILYRLASGTAGTGERVVPALKKATPPKQAAGKSKRPSKAPSVKNKAA
jgi:predicted RNase H-like HicB family nuclease